MKVSNWKKYVTSAAALALVGAGVVGTGSIDFSDMGFNSTVLEAAATPTSAKVIAFDQFVMQGSNYDALANVSAFGTADGGLVNLTEQVTVVESDVDVNVPGNYTVTYAVEGIDGSVIEHSIKVTVGLEPAQALGQYQTTINDLERVLQQVDLGEENAVAIQEQITAIHDLIAETLENYATISETVANGEGRLESLSDELQPLQDSLNALYTGTVSLYDAVESLEQSHEIHKAMAEIEILRLESSIETETINYNGVILQYEAQIENLGDGEPLDALQAQMEEATVRYNSLVEQAQEKIAQVQAELGELDRLDAQSEGRDQIIEKLIERNQAEIDSLELEVREVVAERNAALELLAEEFDGKLDESQLEEANAKLTAVTEYYTARENGLKDRIAEIVEETNTMTEKEAVYAARLQQLRDKLDIVKSRERAVEKEITQHLSGQDEIAKDLAENVEGIDGELADNITDEILNGGLIQDVEDREEVSDPEVEDETVDSDTSEESSSKPVEVPEDPAEEGEDVVDEVGDNVSDEAPEDANQEVSDEVETPTDEADTPTEAPEDLDTSVGNVVEEDVDSELDGEDEPVFNDSEDTGADNEISVGGVNLESLGIYSPDMTLEEVLAEHSGLEYEVTSARYSRSVQTPEEVDEESPVEKVDAKPAVFSLRNNDREEENTSDTTLYAEEATESDLNTLLEQGASESETTEEVAPEVAPEVQQDAPGETPEIPEEVRERAREEGLTDEEIDAAAQQAMAPEGGDVENAEGAKDGALPQTGSSYGAIATAGISTLSAIGALFLKRRRNK